MAEVILHDGKTEVLLRYDTTCWALCWQKNVKDKDTGEATQMWVAEKFYSNPAQALTSLLNMKVGNSDAKTLQQLINVIETVRSELIAVYNTQIKGE